MMIGARKKVGKYIILLNQKLGAGAFSEVFKGFEQDSMKESVQVNQPRKEVAIKVVVKSKIQEDQYAKNAFHSEIHIMKRLKSNNVIQFYHVHETKNNYYIILELAQGGTLRSNLRLKGRLDQRAAMKVLAQIVNGFGELVKNGVIHRDLKPENILIKDDILKIADFGFAKQSENNAYLKTLVGTPAYMAPQILLQQKYTYKCDIWSLGVITYEMMVGKIPWTFLQHSLDAVRKQITTRKIVFPSDIEISANMKSFILGCLCKDQTSRYGWEQVFLHPLFSKIFEANFAHKKKGSTEVSFIMSELRVNVHSNNINLSKILSRYPSNKLTKQDFFSLLNFVDKSMAEDSIALVYNYIAENDATILIEDLKKFFIKHGCRIIGIDPSEIQLEEGSDAKDGLILMTRLKRCIDKNNLDINKLFMGKSQHKKNPLSFQAFGEFIRKIDASLNNNEIECLFKVFDLNKDGKISETQLHKGVCKIAEIVPMEEEE